MWGPRASIGLCLCVALVAACNFVGAGVGSDAGDAAPTITVGFAESASLTDETAGTMAISVVLSAASQAPVTTSYRVKAGTATRDEDYTFADGELLFVPGRLEYGLDLTIVPDALVESDETIELELVSWSGAELGTRTHTITISQNTLPRVRFSTATSMADETGTTSIDVTLDTASPMPITVDYVLTGVASGADYDLVNGTVTFPPDTTVQTLTLGEHGDGLDEFDEDVIVTLSHPTNALIGTPGQRVHTLVDVDAAPTVAFASPPTSSAAEDPTSVTLTVALSTASGKPVTVPFAAAAGSTATSPADYTYASASPLIFSPGITTQTITVNLTEDTLDESTETVNTTLGSPTNAVIGTPATYQLAISDDEFTCYGAGGFAVCLDLPPAGALTLNTSINTDADPRCSNAQPAGWLAAGQPGSCFIARDSITTTGTVLVGGSRPLVLVANTITISGTLDVASHRAISNGPASPSAACLAFAATPVGGNGGGGGAGGSFMSMAGHGGRGDSGNKLEGRAALADALSPTKLRGGCNGQLGGNGGTGNFAGAIGRGGGVVYLVGTTINITGVINASGSAGSGGAVKTGGSGGGSGGMIKLFAPNLDVSGATLLANGGGSASGAQNSGGGSGFDPLITFPTTPAQGGTGEGGDGGDGFAGATSASTGMQGTGGKGGGGGGGGGGYIQSNVALSGATVSAGVIQVP